MSEWKDIASWVRKTGTKVHIGRIFDICVEKNSELPESDPNRKFKGRVVFEGCYVKDEDNNWAIFCGPDPAAVAGALPADPCAARPQRSLHPPGGGAAQRPVHRQEGE